MRYDAVSLVRLVVASTPPIGQRCKTQDTLAEAGS